MLIFVSEKIGHYFWRRVYIFIFCILTYAIIYVLIHHIIFWLYLYFLNILYVFKYSCTYIFHRLSLCTFYQNIFSRKCLYCSIHYVILKHKISSLWLSGALWYHRTVLVNLDKSYVMLLMARNLLNQCWIWVSTANNLLPEPMLKMFDNATWSYWWLISIILDNGLEQNKYQYITYINDDPLSMPINITDLWSAN